jgi:hypothetical protein
MPKTDQFPTINPTAMSRVLQEELKGWELREFQEAVKEASGGARGSSYGAVWSYVNDPPQNPRRVIVEAMAEVLQVRFEYLATGEPPRTERAERDREAVEDRYRDPRTKQFFEALEDSTVYRSVRDTLDLQESVASLAFRLWVPGIDQREDQAAVVHAIDLLLLSPWLILCPRNRDPEAGRLWVDRSYLRAILGAVHAALDVMDEAVLKPEDEGEYIEEILAGLFQYRARLTTDDAPLRKSESEG